MKPEEFQIIKGNESPEFVRSVTLNDRATEIKIVANLNNKKGLFNIGTKLHSGQITGNAKLDDATIKLVSELQKEAIKYALEWKRDWAENNVSNDDDEIDFPED
jgi:hypothetical protein